MKLLDDHFLGFSWSRKTIFFEETDQAEFHHKTYGNIYLFRENKKTLIGKFEVTYINIVGALNAGLRIFDVFDQTGESCGFYETLMSEVDDAFYRDEIYEIPGIENNLGNLLIIDRLEIIKGFRGNRLGAEIIMRLERQFGAGADLVTLKAFPLQHEKSNIDRPKNWLKKMGFNSLNEELSLSTTLLVNYYNSIGFHEVGTDSVMVKPLN